jgi:cell wall-associated NlpC family hydrolase
LIFFRTHVKSGWHVGVYLADHLFVHCTSGVGVYVSSLSSPRYAPKIYAYGRIPIKD